MTATARPTTSTARTPQPAGLAGIFTPVPVSPPTRRMLPSLFSYLQQVPDPRARRGRRHPLAALLALLCLAWLSGIHGYRPAHGWAAALPPPERLALGFTRPGPPAASTLFEVLRLLSWETLETQLRRWVEAVQQVLAGLPAAPTRDKKCRRKLPEVDPQGLAIDGKALRGSWKRGAELAGLLAVVTHELALTVAQVPLSTKEGELTAVRPLLKDLVLTGLVVTVDAQFTQPGCPLGARRDHLCPGRRLRDAGERQPAHVAPRGAGTVVPRRLRAPPTAEHPDPRTRPWTERDATVGGAGVDADTAGGPGLAPRGTGLCGHQPADANG